MRMLLQHAAWHEAHCSAKGAAGPGSPLLARKGARPKFAPTKQVGGKWRAPGVGGGRGRAREGPIKTARAVRFRAISTSAISARPPCSLARSLQRLGSRAPHLEGPLAFKSPARLRASFSTSLHTLASCACANSLSPSAPLVQAPARGTRQEADGRWRAAGEHGTSRQHASRPEAGLPGADAASCSRGSHAAVSRKGHGLTRRRRATRETWGRWGGVMGEGKLGPVCTWLLHSASASQERRAVQCCSLSACTLPRTLYSATARPSTPNPPPRSTPPPAPSPAAGRREAEGAFGVSGVLAADEAAAEGEARAVEADACSCASAAAWCSLRRPHTAAAAAASGEPTGR